MKYLCFDNKSEVELWATGRLVADEPYIHVKRMLDHAVILFGVEGECPISQDGREYILRKGDCMILFPWQEHKGTEVIDVGQSHFWCHFTLPEEFYVVDDISELDYNKIHILPEFFHINDYSKFFLLFSQLIDAANNEMNNEFVVKYYLKILLHSIWCEYYKGSNGNTKTITASKLKNLIEANNYKDISVARASRELGYNTNYFTRLIKKETGFSPIEYINILKVKRAKEILLNSNMKISETAFSSGFSDEKYFIKVFKKYEGVTPSGFRNFYFKKYID